MEICLLTDTQQNTIRAREAEIHNFIMQIKISRNYKINLLWFLHILVAEPACSVILLI